MNAIRTLYDCINQENGWEKDITLKRNEYLKVGGSTDTNIYYVLSGSLKVFIIDEYEEHIIRFGYRDNFITALDSFITDQPSDFYIQAIKQTTLRAISKGSYQRIIHGKPENKLLWDTILEQLILQQMERERDILTTSPKARYERVLRRSPHLFQEVPHKYIASYLRMSPETLSRLKKS